MAQGTKPSPGTDPRIVRPKEETLAGMQRDYLAVLDMLAEFNETYGSKGAAPEGTLNSHQFLALAKSDDWQGHEQVSPLLKEWQEAWDAVTALRSQISQTMSKLTGKPYHAEAPKPDESEVTRMKDRRKHAVNIGKTLATMAELIGGDASSDISKFLSEHQLPGVGTDSTWDATATSTGTTKHRVDVTITKDGNTVGEKINGFTNAVNAAKKARIHARGKAPTQEDLRKVWENREEGTASVSLEYDGATYTITARPPKS